MSQILVTGGSGFLGHHIVRALLAAGERVAATFHSARERIPAGDARLESIALDLEDPASVQASFRACWPEAVVHCAAMSDLQRCEADPERARRINVDATVKLAKLAASAGARFLFLSTDQVFDGERGGYAESDVPRPIHAYGAGKREAEEQVLRAHPNASVLRISLAYGVSPDGSRSATEKVLATLRSGGRPRLFTDEIRSPVLAEDVAQCVVELLPERDVPVLHVAGPDSVSRFELGVRTAEAFGLDPARIEASRLVDVDTMPPRPKNLALDTRRIRTRLRRPPRGLAEGLRHLVESSVASSQSRSP